MSVAPAAEPRPPGRIVTFYSYKGGTGRTMTVANVGWILASAGLRVLLIDWDLEAPGLHRYLHPFLEDRELTSMPGVIDFLCDFALEARLPHDGERWYDASASLLRYTQPIVWKFAGGGALELVGAGRQDAAYGVRVTGFDWTDFHDHLGGGLFLQAVKQRLRENYDFVLIDSRTGISDSSGVCTVQMPDTLFVLFTLNQQSIKGAAAIAASADRQRRKTKDEPGLRIWPVPMRIELAEKERLDAGRLAARFAFDQFIRHLDRSNRSAYWDRVEVIYHAYYAYEEVLAAFADQHRSTSSMLASMESIASIVAERTIQLGEMSEEERERGLTAYSGAGPVAFAAAGTQVYISYGKEFEKPARAIHDALDAAKVETWWDRDILPGDEWADAMSAALQASSVLVLLHGPKPLRAWQMQELSVALERGMRVVPVLVGGATPENLPVTLQKFSAMAVRPKIAKKDIAEIVQGLSRVLERERRFVKAPLDPSDPQRGRFGGVARRNGREVTAEVKEVTPDWFEISLAVRAIAGGTPLSGPIEFHLHPTYNPQVQKVTPQRGVARLTLYGYGAFTVGVVADDGKTTLELNLAGDERFPAVFRSR
jgi:MinD-like ATPase involved in chromosome partitioning or flagellar assembly